jgi:hypothetical protein
MYTCSSLLISFCKQECIAIDLSLVIYLIFIKFFRIIWEIGWQMSWDQCLAESLLYKDLVGEIIHPTCSKGFDWKKKKEPFIHLPTYFSNYPEEFYKN